ncbi:MAG: hypothetical protein JJ863_09220 [Deltaproteobacteria bacterium]|nr:hypothetical protein [Deltaproteobacteria bacterium]
MGWHWRVVLALALGVGACGDDGSTDVEDAIPDGGPIDLGPPVPGAQTFSTVIPDQELLAGEEVVNRCFSWEMNNETEIWVNRVRFETTRGMHHSNWFFIIGNLFEGEDGLWPCRERGFDTVAAAAAGGVLFAQSTQAAGETQAFPENTAMRIPPGARVVADLHLLNTYGEDVNVQSQIHVDTIPADAVETRLRPLAFDYLDLQIPPRSKSEFSMDCDFTEPNDGPLDFSLYYALPHYHALGSGMRLELVGGDRDGEIVWEAFGSIGEALGRTFDPPLDLSGANGIRVTCAYDNPTDQLVRYGVGDQEMCVMLAFTDSNRTWGGGVLERGGDEEVSNDGETSFHEAPCRMIPYASR